MTKRRGIHLELDDTIHHDITANPALVPAVVTALRVIPSVK